jgi:RNA polymerase sigma factor for flagellar operon FliA
MGMAYKLNLTPILTGDKERRNGPRKAPSFGNRRARKLSMGLTKSELIETFRLKVRIISVKMARDLPASVDVDDLMSMGFIGLMDAAEKFDPARGVKFETYAEFRIRGSILDELRRLDWIPRSARDRMNEITAARNLLEARKGDRPTQSEISKEMQMPLGKFQQLLTNLGTQTLVNLEDMPETFEPGESTEADPFQQAVRGEAKVVVARMLEKLGAQERQVLNFYYYRGLNLKEISQILDVSESRVSQVHTQAMANLRQHIKDDAHPVETVLMALIDD